MSRPRLNLVVIRSDDIEKAMAFYVALGLGFTRHTHGNGPMHYASEQMTVTLEIYPATERMPVTSGTRIGFMVGDVHETIRRAQQSGGMLITPPALSPWGLRAVVADPDGHRVELIEDKT